MSVETAMAIAFVALDLSFFAGIFLYMRRMPDSPAESQASEEVHFTTQESFMALKILDTEGPKTPAELAKIMGISPKVAEAMLKHLGRSYLVQCKTLTQWDFSGGQEVIPPTYHITPNGQQARN